jgi:GGDEF domain-containing protein
MRGSLPSFARRRTEDTPETGKGAEASRHDVPLGFDAVGEALVSGRCPLAACGFVGRTLAGDGASLGEALAGLRETFQVTRGSAPDFEAVEAFSVAWSDASLEFLQDVSCEDPLTGLATQQHLRSRLAEVYREAERAGTDVRRSHALVLADTSSAARRARQRARGAGPVDLRFARALQLATVAEGMRTVFTGEETVARLGADMVAALVRREPGLGEAVARLRVVFADLDVPPDTRVWIEGLPGHVEHAAGLLADLMSH